MTGNEFAGRLAVRLRTVDLMDWALGLPHDPAFELARVSRNGLVVTIDTAGRQGGVEANLCGLR
jgi:hypothetical protein